MAGAAWWLVLACLLAAVNSFAITSRRGSDTISAVEEVQHLHIEQSYESEESEQTVRPCYAPGCEEWKDTDGKRIEAHGAGILRSPQDNRWYWYGESAKRDAKDGGSVGGAINCYSADSLAGPWKNEGEVFSQGQITVPEDKGPFVVERPKVLFNTDSQKYVLWFHADNSAYLLRHVGVATADNPAGPFNFSHTFLPDGNNSLDMSLFLDYDGRAYFVRSVNNAYFAISELSADFMNTTGVMSTGNGYISGDQACLEGFAMFRFPFNASGKLFMMTSHCDYWNPNPLSLLRSDGADLSDPQWKDLGNPTKSKHSWNSQPAFVVQTEDENGEQFPVYIGDNWIHGSDRGLQDASYVWFPLRVMSDCTVQANKLYAWNMLRPWAHDVSYHRSPQCVDLGTTSTKSKCWVRLPGGCVSSLAETSTPKAWFIAATSDSLLECLSWKVRFTLRCKSVAEHLLSPHAIGRPCRPRLATTHLLKK
eukprot:TRINITY_DN61272_c0_g1_i1.p1 TRINITY_DN61272_c0_g1~~TRINITY_DN61272_c0_g1_i1.p1  ORF type:complete len:478 (+),score=58.93 TRINITY_DN61272_c0_g1_i1:47-1480(+)